MTGLYCPGGPPVEYGKNMTFPEGTRHPPSKPGKLRPVGTRLVLRVAGQKTPTAVDVQGTKMTFPVGSRTPPRNPETWSGPRVKSPVRGFQTPTLFAVAGTRTTWPEGHRTEPQYPDAGALAEAWVENEPAVRERFELARIHA